MFTRIIVGIDGSDGGRDALALAVRLAAAETEIVIVNAFPYEVRPSRASLGGFEELLREDAGKMLAEATGSDPRYRTAAIPDTSPGRALYSEAEREHADLIVVGSCHRGAVGRVLLGDVSRATLHGAPCPVAVAPRGYRGQDDQPVHTIGVGFNATDESRAALDFATALAQDITGELVVLTAVPSSHPAATKFAHSFAWDENDAANRLAAEQQLTDATRSLGVTVATETVEASPSVALERLSERVDLIVAGSRGWGPRAASCSAARPST